MSLRGMWRARFVQSCRTCFLAVALRYGGGEILVNFLFDPERVSADADRLRERQFGVRVMADAPDVRFAIGQPLFTQLPPV